MTKIAPDKLIASNANDRMRWFLLTVYDDGLRQAWAEPLTGGGKQWISEVAALACKVCDMDVSAVGRVPKDAQLQVVEQIILALHDRAMAAGWLQPHGMRNVFLLTKDGHAERRWLEDRLGHFSRSTIVNGVVTGVAAFCITGTVGFIVGRGFGQATTPTPAVVTTSGTPHPAAVQAIKPAAVSLSDAVASSPVPPIHSRSPGR